MTRIPESSTPPKKKWSFKTMKLSKILLGAVACAAVLGLMSCVNGDPNGMIKGSGSTYTIDYTNEADTVSRGYKKTAMQHAGGLVKVSFEEGSDSDGGVMGFIFDLNGTATNDFYCIGIRDSGKYYVSKFEGVKYLQAKNFGATDEKEYKTEGAKETVYAYTDGFVPDEIDGVVEKADNCSSKSQISLSTDSETKSKYVYIYALCDETGAFNWKILNSSATDKIKNLSDKEFTELTASIASEMVLAEGTIPASDTGYTKQVQNSLAVYANVYSTKTLNGTWNFVGTYKEAEVIE